MRRIVLDIQYSQEHSLAKVVNCQNQGVYRTDFLNKCDRYHVFAETTGNYAKAALGLKLEVGMTVNVQLVVDARKWQTQQGEDRYENRVTITNIARWE